MFIDSHAHIGSERYDGDREAMLQRAHAAGVEVVVSIGIGDTPAVMQRAADLTEEFAGREDMPRLYATAGIHPHEARLANQEMLAQVAALAEHKNVIAIGEIGLDYFYDHSPREQQRAAFLAQMEIAAQARLPIIIHCRPSDNSENAWDDTLDLLEREWAPHGLSGILHCFSGAEHHARRAMAIGFMISFAGNITFAKAQNLRDIAKVIPEDRLLIETDAPFLAPAPNRGKRNEPAFVPAVAAQLALVREESVEKIAHLTTQNFLRFFRLQDAPPES